MLKVQPRRDRSIGVFGRMHGVYLKRETSHVPIYCTIRPHIKQNKEKPSTVPRIRSER